MVRRFAAWSVVVSFLVVWAVPALAQQSPNASPKPSSKAEAKADAVVNLNTASVADLESLPGIGKSTAQRIVEYRQKSGGFKKIEDILEKRSSCPCLLTFSHFTTSSLSLEVARNPSKSRRDSQVVGAVVGALGGPARLGEA
jgi:competence ComEA-like helix-hairpin-helix protein